MLVDRPLIMGLSPAGLAIGEAALALARSPIRDPCSHDPSGGSPGCLSEENVI